MNRDEVDILGLVAKYSDFIKEYDECKSKYYKMREMYNKKIRNKLVDMADGEKVAIGNDVFKINISEPRPTKALITKKKAKTLPEDIKNMVFYDDMTTPRVLIKHIGDERGIDEE